MRSVTWKAVVLALAGTAAGCSSGTSIGASPAGGARIGTVGMELTLPGSLVVNQVSYAISGPNTYSGTVDVSAASVISFGVTNIAPGAGYVLSESASTVDGTVVCSGASAPFAVIAGETTAVSVALACTTAPDAGAILGTTVASECAKWSSALAAPNETTVGTTSQLSASATAPDPSALTFAWTASAGTIDTPDQASAVFTCPATPGPVTLTLSVSDGPVPAGGACPSADTTTTIIVTCDATDAGASGTDAGSPDTGAPDAGPPPPPPPCTAPGQTGCVPCSGNAAGVCSATEALIVQHDITAGNAATTPCYACLLGAGCIDDTVFGDKGNECDDLAGTFGAGPSAGTASSALCIDTVGCVLGTSCASSGVAGCFCGSFSGSDCLTAPTPNGACYAQEIDGLGLSSNQAVLEGFTNTTLPSGMANQLFQCALSNQCAACLQ